jgi:hypothetical protein
LHSKCDSETDYESFHRVRIYPSKFQKETLGE